MTLQSRPNMAVFAKLDGLEIRHANGSHTAIDRLRKTWQKATADAGLESIGVTVESAPLTDRTPDWVLAGRYQVATVTGHRGGAIALDEVFYVRQPGDKPKATKAGMSTIHEQLRQFAGCELRLDRDRKGASFDAVSLEKLSDELKQLREVNVSRWPKEAPAEWGPGWTRHVVTFNARRNGVFYIEMDLWTKAAD